MMNMVEAVKTKTLFSYLKKLQKFFLFDGIQVYTLLFQLRETPADADFDLTDPYSSPPQYNVLHDPHLKDYFQSPTMKRRLVDKGKRQFPIEYRS